jgi:transposase
MEPVFNFVEMFERSIGLKAPWKVTEARFDSRDRSVHVYVEGSKSAQYPCPICGKLCQRYDEEETERVWRHADVVMYPCYVHCRRPRVRCEQDGIHVVDAPWARKGGRQTLLFEGYAMMLAETMTLNEARKILRISRTALMHMVQYWVEKALAEVDLSQVEQISIDETSFKRGQSYVTVIGDPAQKRVIGVEDGRTVDAVERFSFKLEAQKGDCNRIRHVSMDLSQSYKQACQLCFPKAQLVFDHFHVKKMVLDGMDAVRREEQGQAYARRKDAGRKLLMIPQGRLTDEQALVVDRLCQTYPKTGRAFRMVQQFDDLYRCMKYSDAQLRLKALTSWMMHSRLNPMKAVAQSLRRNKQAILEYFRIRISNAFAEGMNSLIQAAKRKARGFRTFQGYRTMIFLAVGKLHLSYPSPFPF